MGQYYLAVDIGASSGRHMLGTVENGRIIMEEIHRFDNGMSKKDGELCWNLEQLFTEIKAGLVKCREFGKIPVSMGIDTWAVDFVLLDKDNRILGNTVSYRDARTEGMDWKVYEKIPEEQLYGRTGIQKQCFNTIYQIMAVKEKHPQYLEQAESMLMIPEYFNYLLTGRKAAEYTNATTTQLVSPMTKDWDWELIDMLGYPRRVFQGIERPGTVLGGFTEELKKEVGFDCKVMLPATHDTGSAVLAVPSNEDRTLYISSGTWSLMGVERMEADCSEESRRRNFTNEGGYDYRFRYLKNIMGLWMIQSLKKELGDAYSFARLSEMAEDVKIASLVDCNDSRFLAPQSMTRAIQEVCRENGQQIPYTPAELAGVIYRSLAACYGVTVEELEEMTGCQYDCLHVVGGGANAEYLNQLTADATGKPVLAGPAEATAIGNLMVQMLAKKEFATLAEARNCVRESFDVKEYTPGERIVIGTRNYYNDRKDSNNMTTQERYEEAKKIYATIGVDTDAAIAKLKTAPVALHCWQGDDVTGFDHDGPLTGGIQTTGNYPGKARTPDELFVDMDKAISLMPGMKKINVHASYAIFENGEFADRDALEPKHFKRWVEFARERGMGLDFNPTFFSHPMINPKTSDILVGTGERQTVLHLGKACIHISQYFAEETGIPCVMNIWTGDGFKDVPADRMGPRVRYKEAIDEILSEPFDFSKVKPCVESKVFGIGVEAYTVGSAEFTLSYAAMNKGRCIPLMDNGHYHPTEVVSDKIPALLTFFPEIALHVTRPIRWDSDHVVLFDDETKEIAKEIVRCGGLDGSVKLALDYFDASINRISAWVVGFRNFQKALLSALVTPHGAFKKLQDENRMTELMVRQEELKTLPFGDVWAQYCVECGVPVDGAWFAEIERYEREVLWLRK